MAKFHPLLTTNHSPLKPPCQPEIVQERQLIDNVIGSPVDIEDVFVIIDVGHGDAGFEGVPLSQVEFLLGT